MLSAILGHESSSSPVWLGVVLVLVVASAYRWYQKSRQYSHLPCINEYPNDWSGKRALEAFTNDAEALISEGIRKYPGQPFRLVSPTGYNIILPQSYMTWLKNQHDLVPSDVIQLTFFTNFPGFEGLGAFIEDPSHFLINLVRSKMTKLTPELLERADRQAKKQVRLQLGESADFHAVSGVDLAHNIMSPVVSTIFCGDQLASDSSWLDLITSYTENMVEASLVLRTWPALLRPLAHWFLAKCRLCRAQVRQARDKLAHIDVDDERLQDTVLAWSKNSPKYDAATLQLGLSFAAIQTSSQLLSQTLLDIALSNSLPPEHRRHPHLISDLRKEISTVLEESGGCFEPSTIANLTLLDACIKETQRFKPPSLGNIARASVHKTVTLPDAHGTVVTKGTILNIPTEAQWAVSPFGSKLDGGPINQKSDTAAAKSIDEADGWGPDAHVWNPYRFIDEAKNARMKAVTVNDRHFGFGAGRHACPGRFIAVANIKIILAELIMGWDIRIAPSSMPSTSHLSAWSASAGNGGDRDLFSEKQRRIWLECGRVPTEDIELDRFTDGSVKIEVKRRSTSTA